MPTVFPHLKKRQRSGLARSDFEKASEFNCQFMDVFTKSEHSQVPLLDRSAPFMEDIVLTKEGVTKLLKGLNPSKALGPDELHPRVLKELATEFLQMTLSQRTGVAENTHWSFRFPLLVKMPTRKVSFSKLSGTGMSSLILSAELSDDFGSKFTSLVRARD